MISEADWKKIKEEQDREEEPRRCPECGSEDLRIHNLCYEDEHHEMIENCLSCNDCDWSDCPQ